MFSGRYSWCLVRDTSGHSMGDTLGCLVGEFLGLQWIGAKDIKHPTVFRTCTQLKHSRTRSKIFLMIISKERMLTVKNRITHPDVCQQLTLLEDICFPTRIPKRSLIIFVQSPIDITLCTVCFPSMKKVH